MKITVTDILPSTKGLVLGLRVEHEKAGWIRFATTVLLVESLDVETRRWLVRSLDRCLESDSRWVDESLFD